MMITKTRPLTLLILLLSLLPASAPAHAALNFASYEDCLLQTLKTAPDSQTVSQIKESCNPYLEELPAELTKAASPVEETAAPDSEMAAVSRRVSHESKTQQNLFSIIPHKQNYILLASYNGNPNGEALTLDDSEIDHTEIKFQVSFKVPVARDLLGEGNGHLYAAYTMKSFWQAYNNDISSPFRDR